MKAENLIYPSHYYSTEEMTDTPIKHTFIKIANLYPVAAVDNSNKSALCSKPYKFAQLYDNWVANGKSGDLVIPCCVIDIALGGEPVEIAAAGMTLRQHFDCQPIHMKIQVATDAAATNWVTVYDATNIVWDSLSKRWSFDPIEAYQVRFIALDIGDVNIKEEGDYYDPIKGDETRFTYAEVDVYTLKSDAGSDTTTPTQKPTSGSQTPATRPVIQTPTRPVTGQTTTPTQAPTRAPSPTATQAPTKAPTQAATQAPTKAPSQTATQAPSQTATQAPSQTATQAPTTNVTTTEPTVAPTEPVVDPSAPTVEPTVEPSAPVETVDPSVPTEEPTEAPTEEATVAPTEEATEPVATEPIDETDGEVEPKGFPWVIVAVAGAVVVAAGAVAAVIIIKKKKNG